MQRVLIGLERWGGKEDENGGDGIIGIWIEGIGMETEVGEERMERIMGEIGISVGFELGLAEVWNGFNGEHEI